MAGVVKKGFGSADEVRTPDKTRIEIVDLGGVKAARMTAQPGWRWSECIKPIAGTESCQTHHVHAGGASGATVARLDHSCRSGSRRSLVTPTRPLRQSWPYRPTSVDFHSFPCALPVGSRVRATR